MRTRIIIYLISLLFAAGCNSTGTDNHGKDIELEDISLTPGEMELFCGEKATLSLAFTPENASHSGIIWTSSDDNVATVDLAGTVEAVTKGRCTLSVFVNQFRKDCFLEVLGDNIPVESVLLDCQELDLNVGADARLVATVIPENAYYSHIEWSSSDNNVASVTSDGLVKGLSAGTADIIAEAGGQKAVCKVTVTDVMPELGDFYYSDGSFSNELDKTKDVIGIIFWIGDAGQDDITLKEDFPDCNRALAVSIKEETGSWQSGYIQYGNLVSTWITDNYPEIMPIETDINAEDNLNKTVGYNNTKGIKHFNNAPENGNWNVDAVTSLMFFQIDPDNTAPASSSGWYLPSAKELSLLCSGDYTSGSIWDNINTNTDNVDFINQRLAQVPGAVLIENIYWSSSELSENGAFCLIMQNGNTSYDNKSSRSPKLRFVLAL